MNENYFSNSIKEICNKKLELYRLSDPQVGIWEAEMTHPEIGLFNFVVSVTFKEEIDPFILDKALNLIIEKNVGLRMHIIEREGMPMQYAATYKYKNLEILDFNRQSSDYIGEWMRRQAQKPFNLIDTDLFYFAIIKTLDKGTVLFIKVHHMLMDAWSLYNILLNKLIEYYLCLKNNRDINDFIPSYSEYIAENDKTSFENLEASSKIKEFWNKEFHTIPGFTVLKPGDGNLKSKRKEYTITEELSDKIKLLSRNTGYSPFIIFLSALSLYVYKITSEKDIVIGSVTLNRMNEMEKKTFGMFVNTVPVRLNIDPDKDFVSYLGDVKRKWKEVSTNQRYTLNYITEDYRKTTKTLEKLFDIVLSYQNVKLDTGIMDYEVEMVENGHQIESLRIHISDRKVMGRFKVEIEYLEDKFTEPEIDTIFRRVSSILENTAENSSEKLYELSMISEEERFRILEVFNNTDRDYPKDKALHRLFEEQVEMTPGNRALVYKESSLTYRELNEKANSLARVLIERGVKAGSIVGILAERSIEMIVGILAILKAGGAYLPFDPTFPKERIKLMLKDSGAISLLYYGVQGHNGFGDEADDIDVINLSDGDLYKRSFSNLENLNDSRQPAYIIYTSGSTGKPKGVIIEHRSVARVVKNTNYIDIVEDDRILQLSNYAFDGSVFDIYGALLNGAALVLVEKEDTVDANRLSRKIKEEGITIFFVTTALFNVLVDTDIGCLTNVKKILFGGERASVEHARRATSYLGTGKVVNVYGPTESTVFATYYPIDRVEDNALSIPIGKPLSNTKIYILDGYGNLLPEGVEGELYISGDGLAKGYLNRPELTEEKFVPNPFATEEYMDKLSIARMYRTGDLAKWLPDGNIEFAGRVDKQVKLRGYRIELGEIEACLTAHSAIKEAVVVVNESNADRRSLCAYLVAKEKVTAEELKKHVQRELPYYMVPSYFIYIENIPLTPNGKINTKALPVPDFIEPQTNHIEPQSKLELLIASVWKKVLEVDKVGINDDFFQIGGHSLLTMKLVAEMKKHNISIKVTDIYENNTIALQSALLLSNSGYMLESEINQAYEVEMEADTKSLDVGDIKTDRFKLIKSVVENTDSYSWEELNCFYRPMAIMYESYAEDYFDIFLFIVSYYSTHMVDGWFTGIFESGLFYEFFKFHESIMKPKTGLSFQTESYMDENEMHQKLKCSLDEDSPVLIPIDLIGMYYTQGYMRSKHRHYLIVKGYDEERGIYHILDNMQIDNGANPIYKDFCIKFQDLYKMNCMYFENYYPDIEAPHMWVLRKCRNLHKGRYSFKKLLMDHLQHLRDVKNNKSVIHYPEYEFFMKMSGKDNMDEADASITVLNFKPVYYDLLYKLLKIAGAESEKINDLMNFVRKTSASWNEIKLTVLDAIAGNPLDSVLVQSKMDSNIKLGNDFRLKLEKIMEQLNIDKNLENSNEWDMDNTFTVKNYRKAEIIRENGKVTFKLSPHTVYDTWDIQDNAPQLLTYPEGGDFIIETKVMIENLIIGPYQTGLIVFLKKGIKLIFGLDKGHRMSLFCPEKGDDYTLFWENFLENSVYLRIKKKDSTLSFYSKKNSAEDWEERYEITECGDVSSCGIFSKTFEKAKFTTEFSKLKYINL